MKTDRPAVAAPAPSAAGAGSVSARSTILIVDDESDMRALLRRILEREGYSCDEAVDADDALARLRARAFDLVLTDVNMPGRSGLDLAEHILSDHPETAVVMVTGVDDRSIAEVALEAGVYGYLIKPFRTSEVLINVMNALRRRRLEVEAAQRRHELVLALRDEMEERARAAVKATQAEKRLDEVVEDAIVRLSRAAELHDVETGAHITRVGTGVARIARRLGYGPAEAQRLGWAARLHDIGKFAVPDRILRKPGALTDDEWQVIRRHPEAGWEVLARSAMPALEIGAVVALTHHERWDGSGYPRGLAGEEIPMEGRIVAVIDVFDALTSDRVYRPALPLDEALAHMRRGRGCSFFPPAVDALIEELDPILQAWQRIAEPIG